MRISSIGAWTTCEQKALQTPPREPYRQSAAALVGTFAHAILAGLPVPKLPHRVSWDQTTMSEFHLLRQADAIAEAAKDELDDAGWIVEEYEEFVFGDDNTGHADVIANHAEHGKAVIDLKTGRAIGAGWLQVGGYIMHAGFAGHRIAMGGILHVPRVKLNVEPTPTLTMRPALRLQRAWEDAAERVDQVVKGRVATYSPGDHCGWCSVDCPVRAKEARR